MVIYKCHGTNGLGHSMTVRLPNMSALNPVVGDVRNDYKKDIKNTSVLIVMPEQKCLKKNNGRKLIDEKILHPAHKECYYK